MKGAVCVYYVPMNMRVTPYERVFSERVKILFIYCFIVKRSERSVLVVTSKIVALSENARLCIGTEQDKETLIRKESDRAGNQRRGLL